MSSATEIFATHGFEGTRINQIADSAGVNKAMISYHFGGKKGLYTEILAATFSEARERFSLIRQSEASADERLREFIETFASLAMKQPALPMMVMREALSGGLHVDEHLMPQFLELFSLLQEIIDQGVEEGCFGAFNPYMTHISLIGSLVFFFAFLPLRSRISDDKYPAPMPEIREYVRHLQKLMSRGLSTGAPVPAPEPA